jgi:hypothetical protein
MTHLLRHFLMFVTTLAVVQPTFAQARAQPLGEDRQS